MIDTQLSLLQQGLNLMIHPGSRVQEILGRAIVDREFRESLFADRQSALATFDPMLELDDDDIALLDGISREQIEEHSRGITLTPSAIIWSPSEGDEEESEPSSEPSDPSEPTSPPESEPEPEPEPEPDDEPPTTPS